MLLARRIVLKEIQPIDIGIIILIIYSILHFCFYSKISLFYYKLWVYISYLFIFYSFRQALTIKTKSKYVIFFALASIVITAFLQLIIAALQHFTIIESSNRYFNLIGSFTSPNFLGAYIGLSFVILMWFVFVIKIKKKVLQIVGLLTCILFLYLILLSNSRGTWLSLIVALILLILTSKQTSKYISKISSLNKVIISISFIALTVFGVNYLYLLKPESVSGRAFVAKLSLQEISKHPIGHGLFSFAGEYNKVKASYFESMERTWEEIKIASYEFSPSNDYILIAFEFGVLALILILGIIAFTVLKTKINRMTRLGLAILVYVCLFALFNSILSSSLLVSVGLIGLAITLKYGEFNSPIKLPKTFNISILKPLVFIIYCSFIYLAVFKLTNENKFKNYLLTKGTVEELNFLAKATEDNKYSKSKKGFKLYNGGYKDEGLLLIEDAYNNTALPSIGKRLAALYLGQKNYKKVEEIYKRNINIEPYRYESRMNLIYLYKKINSYEKIIKLSKEVIDFPVKIHSKKVDRYKNNAIGNLKIYDSLVHDRKHLKGSLSRETLLVSSILNKRLPYKVYLPPINKLDKKLPVIYINDGYSYISKGGLPELLDSLITRNLIKPIIAVFLDPKDLNNNRENVRQELFLCNPKFVDFFTKELIPTIEKRYPISNKREDRTILGLSFGGLAAAYLGNQAPDYFKNIVMQSPAFHPCPDIYKLYDTKPKKDFKMYLSYGTGEDTEEQDLPFIKVLQHNSYNLKIEKIKNGNHKWSVWKEQLDEILLYYFKK